MHAEYLLKEPFPYFKINLVDTYSLMQRRNNSTGDVVLLKQNVSSKNRTTKCCFLVSVLIQLLITDVKGQYVSH